MSFLARFHIPTMADAGDCAECGIHVPAGSGVRQQNVILCSDEHADTWFCMSAF